MRKSPIFAAITNFFFWGIGYIYLEKKTDRAFYLLFAFFATWIFSLWYVTVSGPLDFVGMFWIAIWYFLVSFYIGADAYLIGKVKK
jgi:RsiW-degrading membrane proteinase PrsW (M82 family)